MTTIIIGKTEYSFKMSKTGGICDIQPRVPRITEFFGQNTLDPAISYLVSYEKSKVEPASKD